MGERYDDPRVNNEAAELFFALLALLCVVASVAVLALRVAGRSSAVARELLDGLAPLALPVPALVTAVSMLGSLYFSNIVGYRPCVLCWYQRTAMYPLAVMLVIATVRRDRAVRRYALPIAGIGAAISLYHWLLERWPTLDTGSCSADAPCSVPYFENFGFVTLAFMALAAFVTTLVFLALPHGSDRASDSSTAKKVLS
jgi:disulfide bond formation protein DsbB